MLGPPQRSITHVFEGAGNPGQLMLPLSDTITSLGHVYRADASWPCLQISGCPRGTVMAVLPGCTALIPPSRTLLSGR
jgi:hypothetical protein